ncbi:MAG: 2'-5' RNA ligase [Betaproteobacteria bacterium RIFCSPLOWO2_12_FULL_62_13]|nr:MAG: 2'-5' RNA ligase [Betaproteobacteria bacterium RIFCSPLOWO2_12_FULL_62_13]
MPQETAARLFFALWPGDKVRAALAQLARSVHRQCGGRMMLERNIHLTLLFLGDVSIERIADLHALAAAVAAPPFDLAVDTLNYWRHNRIVWAGAAECPAALSKLVADLAQRLRTAGFPCEEREYLPHITLLRNARRGPAGGAAGRVLWSAGDFVLVQSLRRDGATAYDVIGRWPLGAAP